MRTRSRATPPIAALLAACTASIASAQTTTWTNPNGGLWHDPANWSDGVPSGQEIAMFGPAPTGAILLGQDATCRELSINSPAGLLDLGGSTLNYGVALRTGMAGIATSVVLRNGRLASPQRPFYVGTDPGAEALLRLDAVTGFSGGYFVGTVGPNGIGRGVVEIGPGSSLTCGCAGSLGTAIATGSELRVVGGALEGHINCAGLLVATSGSIGGHVVDLGDTGVVQASMTSLSAWIITGGTVELGLGSSLSSGSIQPNRLAAVDGALVDVGTNLFAHELFIHRGAEVRAPEGPIASDAVVMSTGGRLLARNLRASLGIATDVGTRVSAHELIGTWTFREGARLDHDVPWADPVLLCAGSRATGSPTRVEVLNGSRITGERLECWGAAVVISESAFADITTITCGGLHDGRFSVGHASPSDSYTSFHVDASSHVATTSLSLLRGSSIGLFTAAGSMTGTITLDGILRPSGFLLDGSITASHTGLVEVSLDAAAPAIAATGSCNLAPGLTIVTREGPTIAGDSWPIITASSLSLGDIALPSLPPNLEWDLTQTPTSLSITANTTTARCRPSVDRLSPATIDGYVGDPVLLAAAVSGPVTTMRWHKDGLPLTDGGIYAGTSTPTLAIALNAPVNPARYHLIATGPCGKTASLPIDASIRCGGDFNQDFSVDGDDVIDFFGPWDAGEIEADWNHDGAVDGDDVIGFFAKWDSGC